jgi:hypothetical protein
MLQEQRFNVSGEMVDGDERTIERQRQRLGERHTDQERPDQSRALRHRDRIELGQIGLGRIERCANDAANVADVLARRELRHDTAPLAMDGHL